MHQFSAHAVDHSPTTDDQTSDSNLAVSYSHTETDTESTSDSEKSYADITRILMVQPDQPPQGQTSHTEPYVDIPSDIDQEMPESSATNQPPQLRPKPVHPIKNRRMVHGATTQSILREFATRFMGALRDWFDSLDRYRQLQFVDLPEVLSALAVLHDQFLGDPSAVFEAARRDYLNMKCCSLNAKDLDFHYKRMSLLFYKLNGFNEPTLKHVFLTSLPDELQPDIQRQLTASNLSLDNISLGKIFQLAKTCLDKLCEEKQFFKELLKDKEPFRSACKKPYLQIKCKKKKDCDCNPKKKRHFKKFRNPEFSSRPRRSRKPYRFFQKKSSSSRDFKRRKSSRCFICKKKGHYAKDCPNKREKSIRLVEHLQATTDYSPEKDELEFYFSEQDEPNYETVFALQNFSDDSDSDQSQVIFHQHLIGTGAQRSMLNPHLLPPEYWTDYEEHFKAVNGKLFTTSLITKKSIGSHDEHRQLLTQFYDIVQSHGIMLSAKKSTIATDNIEFLDASDDSWGAILLEEINGKEHFIAYASGQFSDTQKHYHSVLKEILAVKNGIKKFEYHLIGHHFLIRMDSSAFPNILNFKGLTLDPSRETTEDVLWYIWCLTVLYATKLVLPITPTLEHLLDPDKATSLTWTLLEWFSPIPWWRKKLQQLSEIYNLERMPAPEAQLFTSVFIIHRPYFQHPDTNLFWTQDQVYEWFIAPHPAVIDNEIQDVLHNYLCQLNHQPPPLKDIFHTSLGPQHDLLMIPTPSAISNPKSTGSSYQPPKADTATKPSKVDKATQTSPRPGYRRDCPYPPCRGPHYRGLVLSPLRIVLYKGFSPCLRRKNISFMASTLSSPSVTLSSTISLPRSCTSHTTNKIENLVEYSCWARSKSEGLIPGRRENFSFMASTSSSSPVTLSLPRSCTSHTTNKIENLVEYSYITESAQISESSYPLISPYQLYKRPSSFTRCIRTLISTRRPHPKEYIQSSHLDQCALQATFAEQYVTLEIPSKLLTNRKREGYTHLHLGSIRLIFTLHGRKGLPVTVRLAMLDTRFKQYQDDVISTVLTILHAGSVLLTFYPNFNLSLQDPNLPTTLKVQVQIQGAEQISSAKIATLHHQLVYRLQNHALDLPTPEHHSDTLMVLAESDQIPTIIQIPRQIPRHELIKLMPLEWISNYEQFHNNTAPIQTSESMFERRQDGTVRVTFKSPPRFNSEGYPVYPTKQNGHFLWDAPGSGMCDPTCPCWDDWDEDDDYATTRKKKPKKEKSPVSYYSSSFPHLDTHTDSQRNVVSKPFVPSPITSSGHLEPSKPFESVLNWQAQNDRAQNDTLLNINSKVEHISLRTEQLETKVDSISAQMQQIHHNLQSRITQLDSELRVMLAQRYYGLEFDQKEREIRRLQAELAQIESEKQRPTLFTTSPPIPSIGPTYHPFASMLSPIRQYDPSKLFGMTHTLFWDNPLPPPPKPKPKPKPQPRPVILHPSSISIPGQHSLFSAHAFDHSRTTDDQTSNSNLAISDSHTETDTESSVSTNDSEKSYADITRILMAQPDQPTPGQTSHTEPYVDIPSEVEEEMPESSTTNQPPPAQAQTSPPSQKSSNGPWFTFDDLPSHKWRDRLNKMSAWIDLQMLRPGATTQSVLREFATHFTGALRDWFDSLGCYRQLQFVDLLEVSSALAVLHYQFLGDPSAVFEAARQDYLNMKCCSLNAKDLDFHYKRMSLLFYMLNGFNEPTLKHVFLASLPDELQLDIQRQLTASNLSLDNISLGKIFQLAKTCLDKLCEEKQFFKELLKDKEPFRSACKKPYLHCDCSPKKKRHFKKFRNPEFSSRPRRSRKPYRFFRKKSSSSRDFKRRKSSRCFICKKKGHYAKDCPNKREKSIRLVEHLQATTDYSPEKDELEFYFSEQDEPNYETVFAL
ncbi:hypothetical protein KPL71_001197 [Citrus sinensis]|uniref:Uncharacterized protein n=1 Tax=Citrus sinensis TaxID=2711 RepID=A0ACB8NV28_CITSI|nr:hypothetical protein KPL71_001197 [Citrus sinensis]